MNSFTNIRRLQAGDEIELKNIFHLYLTAFRLRKIGYKISINLKNKTIFIRGFSDDG